MVGYIVYWLALLSLWGGPYCNLGGYHRFPGDTDRWGYAGPGLYYRVRDSRRCFESPSRAAAVDALSRAVAAFGRGPGVPAAAG